MISTRWMSVFLYAFWSPLSIRPEILEFLIVTLEARTTTSPAMSSLSITVPLVVIVRPGDGVSEVPAGTPVFEPSGQPLLLAGASVTGEIGAGAVTGDVVGVVGLALGEGAGAGRAGATRAVDEADVTAERVCLVVCFLPPCWWLDVGCFGWWYDPVWVAATATDVLAIARTDARATTVIFRRQPRLTSRATKFFKRITSGRR